jgi:hypothetical protein
MREASQHGCAYNREPMAGINYTREWQRVADRLEWSASRLRRIVLNAETDDERNATQAELDRTLANLNHAREEVARFKAKVTAGPTAVK